MSSAEIIEHLAAVRELTKPGQALATDAPTSTIHNPAWWFDGAPTVERDELHERLLFEARDAAAEVEQKRRAIILAGPPGAGKSTVLADVLGEHRNKYLVIDADEFKRALLREAQADGSYDSWLVPPVIRDLEAAGERFFPLELASLVHEESSYLAKAMRDVAIAAGDNLVIDAVLSSEASALHLGTLLDAAGYDVKVIDVEVPFELSESRIRARWERAYTAALDTGDALGGRWVPSDFAREIFSRTDGRSKPEVAAQRLAEECPAVRRYQVFRTTMQQAHQAGAKPSVDVDRSRTIRGGELVDTVSILGDAAGVIAAAFPDPASEIFNQSAPVAEARLAPLGSELDHESGREQ